MGKGKDMDKMEIDLGYVIQGRDAKNGKTLNFDAKARHWSENGTSIGYGRGWNGVYSNAADALEALESANSNSKGNVARGDVKNISVRRIKLTIASRPVTQQDLATAQAQKQALSVLETQTFQDISNKETRLFLKQATQAMLDLKGEFDSSVKGKSKFLGSVTLVKDGKNTAAVKTSYIPDAPLETADLAEALTDQPDNIVNTDSTGITRVNIDRAFKNAEKAGLANGLDKVAIGAVYATTASRAVPKAELAEQLKQETRNARQQADRYARIQRSLKP